MRSNPATQQMTPVPSTSGARSICPVCAIQAPTGAMASASPRKKCGARVALIERPINQSIEKHRCGPGQYHADDNQQKRAQGRKTIGGHDQRSESKWKRKNSVGKTNQPKKSRHRSAKSPPLTLSIFSVHSKSDSAITIQQSPQLIARSRQNRGAVCEKDSLRSIIQKFPQ